MRNPKLRKHREVQGTQATSQARTPSQLRRGQESPPPPSSPAAPPPRSGPPQRRRPSRRCELLPYNQLECDPGQHRHHVVPDWMLRMAKRGGTERIAGLPSLDEGPAICLEGGSGEAHSVAHKHTDRPAERVASGNSTGVPGTLRLGQAKAISSRAIEKATGGASGGGCDRADIQRQLDQQFSAHNETLVRGVRDARGVTAAIKDAMSPTGPKGK
jgi:hypothetical protein